MVFDLQRGHEINGLSVSNIKREKTQKERKAELSFLYATRCLVLFYISAKYHRTIPKGIPVTEQTRNLFQTKQRKITPKVRKPELSFLYAIVVWPCSTFLPSIIKYSEGSLTYRADTISMANYCQI